MRHFFVRLIISYLLIIGASFLIFFLWLNKLENPLMRISAFSVLSTIQVVFAAGFTYIHYIMLIAPLKKLSEVTGKISKGDYGTRVKTGYFDESVDAVTGNINKMASEFENLEEMRKQFVASASHEMRSPLTSMQGFLQGIIDGTIPEIDRQKYLLIVYDETKRLSALINSMLDLSRMDSGKYELVRSRYEINEQIRRVVIRFEPNLLKKEIQLDVDFVQEFSYVFADKDRIEQVLINLIDNAIKYSPSLSRILITTHIHSKKLYVSVRDKGMGISKSHQLLIWDRFFMADKARTPVKTKGTGLGLAIVKKIIDEHREIIWVESSKGAGSTFIFTLPLFDPAKHKVRQQRPVQPPLGRTIQR